MTVGESIKHLVNAENYAEVRMGYSDEFIDFIHNMIPSSYDLIEEKEKTYQILVKLLNSGVCL